MLVSNGNMVILTININIPAEPGEAAGVAKFTHSSRS